MKLHHKCPCGWVGPKEEMYRDVPSDLEIDGYVRYLCPVCRELLTDEFNSVYWDTEETR